MQPSLPPVKPVLEFDIPSSTGGGWSPLSAAFNPAGDTLVIHYPIRTNPPNFWWRYHGPDVVAGVGIASLVLILILIRRVLRHPQTPDRIYCRRCNYDVSPSVDQQSPPQTCPECGLSTAKNPPRPGKKTPARLFPLLGILLPLFLICLKMWYSGVEAKTATNVAWPLETLGRFQWWPVGRHTIDPIQSRVFETYLLPAATKLKQSVIDFDPWEGKLTSDIRKYVYSQMDEFNQWKNKAVVFDPTTGRSRQFTMGDSSTGFCKFHGYTPDETEAIYTHISLVDGAGKCTAKILCLNLETMKMREVAEVEVTPQSISQNNWQLPSLAAAVCNDPPRWAFTPTSGPTAGQLDFGTFGVPGEKPKRSRLANPPAISGIGSETLSYTSSGVLLLNGNLEVLPESGAVRTFSDSHETLSASLAGNILIITKLPATRFKSFGVDPSLAGSSFLNNPMLSPDGRWLVVQFFILSTPPQPAQAKCLVFDVSRLP